MVNLLKTYMENGLKQLEGQLSNPQFKFQGSWYTCVITTTRDGMELEVGGFASTVEKTILVRKDIMPLGLTADSTIILADSTDITADSDVSGQPPTVGKQVIQQGRTFRVLQVRMPPTQSHYELDLGSVNR